MKVGDKVEFILYDKNFTGVVNKVYKREGWKGYTNVTVEETYNIDIVTGFLKVTGGKGARSS